MFLLIFVAAAVGANVYVGSEFPSGWTLAETRYPRSAMEIAPVTFDPAERWPGCERELTDATDQGDCGSCWALAPLLAISARLCVAGSNAPRPSAWHAISCRRWCGSCRGGSAACSISEWGARGYADAIAVPYDTYAVTKKNRSEGFAPTPRCSAGAEVVSFGPGTFREIRFDPASVAAAVSAEGPCVATISVYDDLVTWSSADGPYVRRSGSRFLGGHGVRIIGWDRSAWVIANTWGRGWGANGTFRMPIGKNECGIESVVRCPNVHL